MPAKLCSDLRVDIPKSGFKDNKGHYYIYTYLYPELKKENSSKQIYVGNIDVKNNKLIPSNNYFSFFKKKVEDCEVFHEEVKFALSELKGSYDIGLTLAINKLMDEYELTTFLTNEFGIDITTAIKSIVCLYLSEGSVVSNLDDFANTHLGVNITSREVSNLFNTLCDKEVERKNFCTKWVKKVDDMSKKTYGKSDVVAYDVTSVSSYQTDNIMVKMGYNRDKETLPQINVGMYAAVKSRLPLFYLDYDGSITDAENLNQALLKAKEVGINNVKLVMDGGHFDSKRIEELAQSGHIFYVGMPTSLDVSKNILAKERGQVESFKNRTELQSTFAKLHDEEVIINNISGRVCVIFSPLTRDLEYESLKYLINKYVEGLNDGIIKRYKTVAKKKKYTSKFDFTELADGGFSFELNEDKLEQIVLNSGYCTVFTNDSNPNAQDICWFYREKDVDEKLFDDMKNALEAKRLHTHGYSTTKGKLFTFFIALIVRSLLKNKLRSYMDANRLRMKDVFNYLESIRVVKIDNEYHQYLALSKKQKDIIQLLNLDLEEAVEKLNQLKESK